MCGPVTLPSPSMPVVLEDAERVRAFTVWPEGDGYEMMEVTEQ
jgi:hypothetical protein